MWDKKERLEELGVDVLVVTFETRQMATAYLQESTITWPLVIDKNKQLYKSYQMNHANFWDLWGPKSFWVYLKQLLQGNLPQKPTGDISQRGGDVLLDEDGDIKLHHVGTGPADRPSIKMILDIVLKFQDQKLK